MLVPDTFYIALCVTILMLGVVYWFWTQFQYLQRKINLLDNVVYEMKTFITNLPGPTASVKPTNTIIESPMQSYQNNDVSEDKNENNVPTVYNPPPESVAGDLEAERLASEIEFELFSGENTNINKSGPETVYTAPPEDSTPQNFASNDEHETDDLQPGGLAVGSDDIKKVSTFSDASIESPLSSMSIKDLRRMAEANNIPGSSELRKRDLIRLLRDKVGQIIGQDKNETEKIILSLIHI